MSCSPPSSTCLPPGSALSQPGVTLFEVVGDGSVFGDELLFVATNASDQPLLGASTTQINGSFTLPTDTDSDGRIDGLDNCKFVSNFFQPDGGHAELPLRPRGSRGRGRRRNRGCLPVRRPPWALARSSSPRTAPELQKLLLGQTPSNADAADFGSVEGTTEVNLIDWVIMSLATNAQGPGIDNAACAQAAPQGGGIDN